MPSQNIETALFVEEIIRSKGAVPATIGIIGGRIKVGLSGQEIDYLASAGMWPKSAAGIYLSRGCKGS